MLRHVRASRLRCSLLRVVRVGLPCFALTLLLGHEASVGAQPPAKLPGEIPPCPPTAASAADAKQPCVAAGGNGPGGGPGEGSPGGAAPGSGGAGGGSGSQSNSTPASLGPYRVVKVMDRGGEAVSGIVCAIDRPFVVRMQTRPATFDIKFEPADKSRGAWTYAYDIPAAGESHRAHGDHTVSAAAADGTRSLTIDGPDFVTFRGFAGPIQMHYVMGLAPIADGGACGR
jgi:hypothetical protein